MAAEDFNSEEAQPPKKHRASSKKRKIITPSGNIVELTRSQKAYADVKLSHPELSLTDVARESYPNAGDETLRQIVRMNEKNENIAVYTQEHLAEAKLTVLEIMRDKKIRAETRLRAATDVQDRTEGKAVQMISTTSMNVNVNMEASVELNNQFAEFLKQQTQQ